MLPFPFTVSLSLIFVYLLLFCPHVSSSRHLSRSLMHHTQTTGAKVTGPWQCWWQCRSTSRLSQYWHREVWKLPTSVCLSTVEACQPISVQAKNLPTNDCWTLYFTNQFLPNHRTQVYFHNGLKRISDSFLGNVLLCRLPTLCLKK